jgi:predicted kinase
MLYVIRGLPGSGKSTLGSKLAAQCYAADDYFVGEDGVYRFDPTKLSDAHLACQENVARALNAGGVVAVANTFCERWELMPYLKMAKGREVVVISLFDQGFSDVELMRRNTHGVTAEAIRRMRQRYDHILAGDPRAPWER